MNNEGLKKTAIYAGVFGFITIGAMLYRAGTKHIIIADAAMDIIQDGASENAYDLSAINDTDKTAAGTFVIPLPSDVSSTSITLDDRYSDHELLIYIDSRDASYYRANSIRYNDVPLTSAECVPLNEHGDVCLRFGLNGLYENTIEMSEGELTVSVQSPDEVYDNIVVIDPRYGGDETGNANGDLLEKDINIQLASYIKDELDKTDNIRAYVTRLGDTTVSEDERLLFIEESGADFILQVKTESDDGQGLYGFSAYYNDVYYIRDFGNAEFADMIFINAVSGLDVKGAGVLPESRDNTIIASSVIPSASISAGYIDSVVDKDNLADETYLKQVAKGVADGIIKSFEETSTESDSSTDVAAITGE